MAFTAEEHVQLRNIAEREATTRSIPVRWLKAQIKDIFDDLDTWLESEKPTISSIIDTAAPALSLTNAEKKWLFAVYMQIKFPKELL
jgi:hypothetical protein